MADFTKRQRGAILGAVVADAAARPLHWVYKQEDMQSFIVDKDKNKIADFAFLPENKCPFYDLPTGSSSCYGDEFIVTLKALESNENKFDLKKFKEAVYTMFGGKENRYQTARKERDPYPVKGPWLHGSIIDFVDKYEKKEEQTGGDHKDNDGLMGALSLTVILAAQACAKKDKDEEKKEEKVFPEKVIKDTIGAIINKEDIIARGVFICRLVFDILTGDGKEDIVSIIYRLNEKFNKDGNKTVYGEVNAVFDDCNVVRGDDGAKRDTEKELKFKSGQKEVVADGGYGKACPNPGSFKSPLYNVIINSGDYKKAILEEIEAGGDSTSRAAISGCIIGALLGEDGIPQDWIKKTSKYEEVDGLIKKILG